MKNTKIKVLVITLAVCLLAIGSLGTLAWFTAEDEVTNQFLIADSDDDPDEIFSIDVWEDKTPDDPDGEEKIQDGIKYEDLQPGDDLYKEVNIENTGYYDQYVRAIVTVTGASVWQEVYGETFFALGKIATDLNPDFVVDRTVYDADADTITYTLYYNNVLESEEIVTLFTKVEISEDLNQEQAAKLVENRFNINVTAQAVQTENVGNNAIEAFTTVKWYDPAGFYIIASDDGIEAALKADGEAYIYANVASLNIDYPVKDKTIDFQGKAANVVFGANATAENVTVKGIKDEDSTNSTNIVTTAGFTGDINVVDCYFTCGGTNYTGIKPVSGNITVDNCTFEGVGKSYGIYYSGLYTGNLTVKNSTFKNLGSWAIQINNKVNGNVTIDNNTFDTKDGAMKVLSGITETFTFTNNKMIGLKGHDGKGVILSVTAPNEIITGNTLDGVDWVK